MKTIGAKIKALILICSISISITITGIGLFVAGGVIEEQAQKIIMEKSIGEANNLNAKMIKYERIVQSSVSLAKSNIEIDKLVNDENYIDEYRKTLGNSIKQIAEDAGDTIAIYLQFNPEILNKRVRDISFEDENGKLIEDKEDIYKIDEFKETNEDMEWYYKGIKEKKGVWLKPYIDSKNKINMITYSEPIYVNNILIGVIGIDISFESFKKYINDMKIYDSGFSFLVDENLDYVVHKQYSSKDNLKSVDNEKYKTVADKIESSNSGVVNLNFDGENNIMGYGKLMNGYTLFIVAPKAIVLKSITNVKFLASTVLFIGIIASIIVANITGRKLSKFIYKIIYSIDRAAKLDLGEDGKELGLLARKDELGKISLAITKLKSQLRDIILNLKENAEKILKNSKDADKSTSDILLSIDEISLNIDELAKGASKQAQNSKEASSMLLDLSNEIDDVVKNSELVKEYSKNTQFANKAGGNSVNVLIDKFNENKEVILNTVKNIDDLFYKSVYINEIVSTIKSISKNTKMLALNASIEAARSGEEGKGFAVVAKKIENLSEQTAKAAEEISKTIEEVSTKIQDTKKGMDWGQESLEESEIALQDSEQAFMLINSSVENIINHIDLLVKSIQVVALSKEKALEAVEEINSISQQSADSIEQVSSYMQEELIVLEKVADGTRELKEISENLHLMVGKFKI